MSTWEWPADAPYQVNTYIDATGDGIRLHTEHCASERDARHAAINTLLSIYQHLIHPHRAGHRMYWCELTPSHWINGHWEPHPGTGGDVDVAYLDSAHGAITFDLAASLRRRHPTPPARLTP